MSQSEVIPELKQIIGALLFAARKPLTVADVFRVLKEVGEAQEGPAADFATLSKKEIEAVMTELRAELERLPLGFRIQEVAKGYRLENDAGCGIWVRALLEKGKANRLSKPALETLAVIAYRQPCTRGEIEKVRGVAVDQMVRNLLEMGLIKVTGRSELPGRPWLFGSTQKFLEHFGLKNLKDLPGIEDLRQLEAMKQTAAPEEAPAEEEAAEEAAEETEASATEPEEVVEEEEDVLGEVGPGADDEDDDDDEADEEDDEFDDDDDPPSPSGLKETGDAEGEEDVVDEDEKRIDLSEDG